MSNGFKAREQLRRRGKAIEMLRWLAGVGGMARFEGSGNPCPIADDGSKGPGNRGLWLELRRERLVYHLPQRRIVISDLGLLALRRATPKKEAP